MEDVSATDSPSRKRKNEDMDENAPPAVVAKIVETSIVMEDRWKDIPKDFITMLLPWIIGSIEVTPRFISYFVCLFRVCHKFKDVLDTEENWEKILNYLQTFRLESVLTGLEQAQKRSNIDGLKENLLKNLYGKLTNSVRRFRILPSYYKLLGIVPQTSGNEDEEESHILQAISENRIKPLIKASAGCIESSLFVEEIFEEEQNPNERGRTLRYDPSITSSPKTRIISAILYFRSYSSCKISAYDLLSFMLAVGITKFDFVQPYLFFSENAPLKTECTPIGLKQFTYDTCRDMKSVGSLRCSEFLRRQNIDRENVITVRAMIRLLQRSYGNGDKEEVKEKFSIDTISTINDWFTHKTSDPSLIHERYQQMSKIEQVKLSEVESETLKDLLLDYQRCSSLMAMTPIRSKKKGRIVQNLWIGGTTDSYCSRECLYLYFMAEFNLTLIPISKLVYSQLRSAIINDDKDVCYEIFQNEARFRDIPNRKQFLLDIIDSQFGPESLGKGLVPVGLEDKYRPVRLLRENETLPNETILSSYRPLRDQIIEKGSFIEAEVFAVVVLNLMDHEPFILWTLSKLARVSKSFNLFFGAQGGRVWMHLLRYPVAQNYYHGEVLPQFTSLLHQIGIHPGMNLRKYRPGMKKIIDYIPEIENHIREWVLACKDIKDNYFYPIRTSPRSYFIRMIALLYTVPLDRMYPFMNSGAFDPFRGSQELLNLIDNVDLSQTLPFDFPSDISTFLPLLQKDQSKRDLYMAKCKNHVALIEAAEHFIRRLRLMYPDVPREFNTTPFTFIEGGTFVSAYLNQGGEE